MSVVVSNWFARKYEGHLKIAPTMLVLLAIKENIVIVLEVIFLCHKSVQS